MTDGPATRRRGSGARPGTDQRETDLRRVEQKWQRVWDELGIFRARDDGSTPRRYLLTMFPYPSGDLHMGHAEVFALEDVLARYWRLRGFDVLNPIGWDSFGLPAENAAIRRGENPAVFTYANIETQAASIRRYGVSFDWSRRLHTSDPEYYRWTQWLFLRLRERGLAYRATSPVNWCPRDQTVLANEQVVQGACERCGTAVTKRELTQWFFRVTAYADRLLDDMDLLAGAWPERVLTMQRHWIGRSAGALVRFAVVPGSGQGVTADRPDGDGPVTVFTTRPDTLPGATFLAVAPDAPLAERLCAPQRRAELDAYLELVRRETDVDRLAADRRKTGVFLGVYVVNPATGRPVPVWAADYVLADHGTGAVMGVPGQDDRDRDFAAAHGLPVARTTTQPEGRPGAADAEPGVAAAGPGAAGSAAPWPALDGLRTEDAADAVIAWLESTGAGERTVTYRLRDWLVSRQRYWGCPIPIVHCASCGEVPVPDEELPVRLPDLRGADLAPRGVSPLAAATDWVATTCPSCGGAARRDTDTMDTFVDSSWYFLRYCSPGYQDGPFDPDAVRRWMPVARYVGGVEHAILHLLYSRFVTKVLHDLGLLDVVEPFASLLNQGQVINRGRAMSKSLGNGVELGAQLDAYGSDAVRMTMVFAGPAEDDVDWADVSPGSAVRFLHRALRLADDVASRPGADVASGDLALRRATHRTAREATELVESSRFNVLVARVMELVTAARRAMDSGCGAADPAVREAAEVVAVILGLVAPYTAEEMWQKLGHQPSVATAGWPEADASLLTEDTVVAAVQVDGRLRARLTVPAGVDEAALRQAALTDPAVLRAVGGARVTRVVVRVPRLVNVVTGGAGGEDLRRPG